MRVKRDAAPTDLPELHPTLTERPICVPPDLFPFGCLGLDYFATLVGKTAVPLVVILVAFLMHAILKRLAGPSKPLTLFVAEAFAAFGFLFLIVAFPLASLAVFQFYICGRFNGFGEDGYKYLLKDHSVDCNGDQYNTWKMFIITMIVAWPIGVPSSLTSLLYKERAVFKRIQQAHKRSGPAAGKEARGELTLATRFLSAGYTPECFWCSPLKPLNSNGTQRTQHSLLIL